MRTPNRGIVSAGHAATANAGATILREGGNAVDAAVAAAFASFVAEPLFTDLGGGGYMLVSSESGDQVYDFFVSTPGKGRKKPWVQASLDFRPVEIDFKGTKQVFHAGLGSGGVPGNIHGLCTAHKNAGRLPLQVILEPARALAKTGVIMSADMVHALEIIGPIFQLEPALRQLVSPHGTFLQEGETLRFSHLVEVFDRISEEGASPYYTGDCAQALVKSCEEFGGLITQEDLASYETIIRPARIEKTRHGRLITNPLPSVGGPLVSLGMRLIEELDWDLQLQEPEACVRVAQLLRQIERSRERHLNTTEPLGSDPFTDSQRVATIARQLLEQPEEETSPIPSPEGRGSTTHISVVDENGMAASITTSNGEGSGFLVPGAGIHLNNMLGEEDVNPHGFHQFQPGIRLPSTMCPTVFDDGQGRRTVLGSGGSSRIRSAIFQVVLRLGMGASLQDAVNAPRMHFQDQRLHLEPGWPQGTEFALKNAGLDVHLWQEKALYFGGVHSCQWTPEQSLVGMGDPRRGGKSASAL